MGDTTTARFEPESMTAPVSPYKIESGIEKPLRTWKRKTPYYPFEDMKVGQSFSVPVASRDDPATVQSRVCQAAWSFRKRWGNPDWIFSTRQLSDESGDSIVRCWRDK